jgi:hypothetical protein
MLLGGNASISSWPNPLTQPDTRAFAGNSPKIASASTDLPQPVSPSKAMRFAGLNSMETQSTAGNSKRLLRKITFRYSIRSVAFPVTPSAVLITDVSLPIQSAITRPVHIRDPSNKKGHEGCPSPFSGAETFVAFS